MRVSRGVTLSAAAVSVGLLVPLLTLAPAHAVRTDDGRAGTAPGSSAPARGLAPQTMTPPARRAVPRLRVTTAASGLDHAWDVDLLARGALIVTERDKHRISVVRRGRARAVSFPNRIWSSGETGLMSVAVVPRTKHRTFLTCSGWETDDGPEIQVRRWRLSKDGSRARSRGLVLGGIPVDSGRHGGCRLEIDRRSGDIWVGTGDSARSGVSRNLSSLGGKTLRMTAAGKPSPHNPWARHRTPARRYVHTYGHRNVQGLARRPGGGMWSVEHGPSVDDEVNALRAGGDYGWDPGPGYDSSVPMTDHSLPGTQIDARWSSGDPTLATSGAVWVRGRQWGRLDGTLAVAALAAEELVFMKFDARGRFVRSWTPGVMQRQGRLRSVTLARDGDLLVTTDNGGDDKVLRVSPRR